MHRILEFITEQTTKLSGITIGSAAAGTAAGTLDGHFIFLNFVHTDLLSLLQYAAYAVSIVVGILTVISWCRKNKKNKKTI